MRAYRRGIATVQPQGIRDLDAPSGAVCRTSSRSRAGKSSSPWTPGGREKWRNLHDDMRLHPAAHRLKLGSPVCTLGRMVALPGVGDKDVSGMGCSIHPSRAESWIRGR